MNRTLKEQSSIHSFMKSKELVKLWIDKWVEGDIANIPIADDFIHESPLVS